MLLACEGRKLFSPCGVCFEDLRPSFSETSTQPEQQALFDLANPLSRDSEEAADLLKRFGLSVFPTQASGQNLPVPLVFFQQ